MMNNIKKTSLQITTFYHDEYTFTPHGSSTRESDPTELHSCFSQDTYLRTKEIRDRVSRNNNFNSKRP